MLVTIDPQRDEPLFVQVAASIRTEVAAGRLAPGDRLPSARELAASLDVNVHTVLKAYQDLCDEGLVEMRRGRGATLTAAASRLHELTADIAELVAKARALGVDADTLASLVKEATR